MQLLIAVITATRSDKMARPQTLFEVSERVNAGERFGPMLAEFLDEFYLDETEQDIRQWRISIRPLETSAQDINLWLGATAEHLAQRWNLVVPEWTQEDPFIRSTVPFFYPKTLSLRKLLFAESPPAFRRRQLWTYAEPLSRARLAPHLKCKMPWDG